MLEKDILDDDFTKTANPNYNYKSHPTNRFGIYLAKVSFVFGTVLLLGFLFIKQDIFIILGMFYCIIAFTINFTFFIYLLLKKGTPSYKKKV